MDPGSGSARASESDVRVLVTTGRESGDRLRRRGEEALLHGPPPRRVYCLRSAYGGVTQKEQRARKTNAVTTRGKIY